MSHTKGPWIVVATLREEDEIVCDMLNALYIIPGKGQALGKYREDAQLISASPDLLEALEDLKREIVLSNIPMEFMDNLYPFFQKANDAISKARGHQ